MTTSSPTPSSESMQWGDLFLLGFGPIDDVHEEFVELLGRLQLSTDQELPVLLDEFRVHLKRHFDLENSWMIETEFPPRECHIDEHAAVMQSVQEVQKLLAEGNFDICRELVNELVKWFPKHADQLDSALAHWMTKLRLGGKPVVVRRGLKLR